MAKKKTVVTDLSTEEKIKEAARIVFTRKGYAATRTRDIAEEAGLNLALLNYYFRSKEKLFHMIMLEKMQQLFGVMIPLINNPDTTLESKVEQIVASYIDMLKANPDLPLFVLSEMKQHAKHLTSVIPVDKVLPDAILIKQLQEKRPDIHPVQFLLSILSMTIFPFVVKPVFTGTGILKQSAYDMMLEERKKLVPLWVKAMLKAK